MENKVVLKHKQVLLDGFCRIERYNLKHKLFNGKEVEYSRDLMIKPKVAAGLPYDPILDKIVLIEQFRVGAFALEDKNPWLMEIVAGLMDSEITETEDELIRREVFEEIRLPVLTYLPICNYYVSPGCSTEKVALFCVKVDASNVTVFGGLESEHEDIKVHTVLSQEAFDLVRSGKINNAVSIIALQWLELNLNRVRKEFLDI
jgi:ADP-ribose pyrophosphatase